MADPDDKVPGTHTYAPELDADGNDNAKLHVEKELRTLTAELKLQYPNAQVRQSPEGLWYVSTGGGVGATAGGITTVTADDGVTEFWKIPTPGGYYYSEKVSEEPAPTDAELKASIHIREETFIQDGKGNNIIRVILLNDGTKLTERIAVPDPITYSSRSAAQTAINNQLQGSVWEPEWIPGTNKFRIVKKEPDAPFEGWENTDQGQEDARAALERAGLTKTHELDYNANTNMWFISLKPVDQFDGFDTEAGDLGSKKAIQDLGLGETHESVYKGNINKFVIQLKPEAEIPPGDLTVVNKIPAGEGRELHVLNNGDSFIVDTTVTPDIGDLEFSHIIEDQIAPGFRIAVLSDGTQIRLNPEKVEPTDITTAQTITHQDGTQTVILNDGTKINVGREQRAPTEARVVDTAGRTFVQDTSGNLQQLPMLTMEQVITRAILNNDWEAAVALDEFRNRPTSTEALQAAMDFSRSPADSAVISALARGEPGIVEQDFQLGADVQALGGVRRIGPQPEFLQTAYQRFQESIQAGRPPTMEDIGESWAEKFQSPQIEALNAGIAQLEQKLTNIDALLAGDPAGDTAPGAAVEDTPEEPPAAVEPTPAAAVSEDALSFDRLQELAAEANLTYSGMTREEQLTSGLREEVNALARGRQAWADRLGPPQVQDIGARKRASPAYKAPSMEEQFELFTRTPKGSGSVSFEDFKAGLYDGKPTEFAGGGTTFGNNLEIVGEEGPELVDLPPGTVVTPLDDLTEEELNLLQSQGVKGFQEGGLVTNPSAFPLGVRQLLGGSIIAPARSVFPVAGLTVPSQQARRRLLPSEFEFLRGLSEEAGIPSALFERELASTRPGRSGRRARFMSEIAN